MTNNYYAVMDFPGAPLQMKLHIGNSSGGAGLSTISGTFFPTVEAWSAFLLHHRYSLHIEDEYSTTLHDVEAFVENYLIATPEASARQLEAVRGHGIPVLNTPPAGVRYRNSGEYWLSNGRLFLNSEFS